EACYGPLPAEALERLHRRMLGLRPVHGAGTGLSVVFTEEEAAALKDAADGRALAPFVRETVLDRLTAAAEQAPGDRSGGGCTPPRHEAPGPRPPALPAGAPRVPIGRGRRFCRRIADGVQRPCGPVSPGPGRTGRPDAP